MQQNIRFNPQRSCSARLRLRKNTLWLSRCYLPWGTHGYTRRRCINWFCTNLVNGASPSLRRGKLRLDANTGLLSLIRVISIILNSVNYTDSYFNVRLASCSWGQKSAKYSCDCKFSRHRRPDESSLIFFFKSLKKNRRRECFSIICICSKCTACSHDLHKTTSKSLYLLCFQMVRDIVPLFLLTLMVHFKKKLFKISAQPLLVSPFPGSPLLSSTSSH